MKRIILSAALALSALCVHAQTNADSADKLGWQLAVHSYTFRKFSIDDAIAKTAAMGVHYMSISGSVNFIGTNSMPTTSLRWNSSRNCSAS